MSSVSTSLITLVVAGLNPDYATLSDRWLAPAGLPPQLKWSLCEHCHVQRSPDPKDSILNLANVEKSVFEHLNEIGSPISILEGAIHRAVADIGLTGLPLKYASRTASNQRNHSSPTPRLSEAMKYRLFMTRSQTKQVVIHDARLDRRDILDVTYIILLGLTEFNRRRKTGIDWVYECPH